MVHRPSTPAPVVFRCLPCPANLLPPASDQTVEHGWVGGVGVQRAVRRKIHTCPDGKHQCVGIFAHGKMWLLHSILNLSLPYITSATPGQVALELYEASTTNPQQYGQSGACQGSAIVM